MMLLCLFFSGIFGQHIESYYKCKNSVQMCLFVSHLSGSCSYNVNKKLTHLKLELKCSLIFRDSDTDSENVSSIRLSVSDVTKTDNSKGVSLIDI